MLSRRSRASLGILTSVVMVSGALAVPAGAADDVSVPQDAVDAIEASKSSQTYIVVMDGDPVVTYDGDVPGLRATAPRPGTKIDPNSSAVRNYRAHLSNRADRALERAGADGDDKVYQYGVTLDGFAAELTGTEAIALQAVDTVLAVVPDERKSLDTNTTPDFLGLTGPDGVWEGLGLTGEDVVVGVVDSGVWPENPSFTDRTGVGPNGQQGRLGYRQLPGWNGRCTPGDDFTASDCNRKLIGATYYVDGYGAQNVRDEFPLEYLSPRDADGHGTHTASTAAGNEGVATEFGEISGIAPRARVAAYKSCWGYQGEGGCFNSDNVAAIDQAVADGVDVINYSISGTASNYLDPVEVAFLFAADAGVVVNASAGNSGPGAATANHPSPWINTVAAGTEEAAFAGELVLGDGDEYAGAPSIDNPGTAQLPLVFAGDIAADGVAVEDAALCRADTLDPAGADGTMVICNRGAIARVAKSDEAARAGAAAMILANVDDNSSLNSDAHVIPTIHVDNTARQQVAAYMAAAEEAGETPTAAQTAARVDTAVAPDVAGFSSRGPIGTGDVLKPDVMAPGVDVLAAYSPRVGGRDFDFLSGTSMSSPHAAGHAALLTEAHPDWSSAAIQSAMMTTAYDTRTDGSPIAGGPFAYGSGHVDPLPSVDPGLVFDAGSTDWLGFLCGTGQLTASYCPDIEIDPSDLNEPNLTIGELAGSQTLTRTVTNVGDAGTYEVEVDAPAGVAVTVEPSSVRLGSGESATIEVAFETREGAAIGEWTTGEMTWSDGDHTVTSQLVVRPVQLAAPGEVLGEGTSGSLTWDVSFGYSGDFTAGDHGLVPAGTTEGTVVDDPSNDVNTALATGVGVTFHVVDVPAGTAYTRFSLFDEDTDGDDDLDLYVFGPTGSFVGGSGSGTSEEHVDVLFPAAGTYLVAVHGWQTDGPDSSYTLFDWSVSADPTADDDSLVVDAPITATLGETAQVTASWDDLDAGTRYLGAVSYADVDGVFSLTTVPVRTD